MHGALEEYNSKTQYCVLAWILGNISCTETSELQYCVLVLFSGLNKGVTVFWHIRFVIVCDQNGVKLRVQMRDHL